MHAAPPSTLGPLAKYLLLGVTVLGTMSNNIISVPLSTIADDFNRPISAVVLSVSAFILVLAVAMPISGWVGQRFGPKKVLLVALALMLVAQVAAALAPNLELLITARAFQGLGCSAIPPIVMGMLVVFFPDQRLRMMGSWAAANGVGQAIGPPIGGVVSDLTGWRSIFVLMSFATLLMLVGIARSVPTVQAQHSRLHVTGALLLSTGTASLLVALTALSLSTVPDWVAGSGAILGAVLIGLFIAVSRNNPRAMIPPRLMIEPRFLRSSLAGFAQMFVLGAVLVAMPLYFTGPLDLSSSQAGVLFFILPLAMAIMAPLVSRLGNRIGPRPVLRGGLMIIVIAALATGVATRNPGAWLLWPVLCLLALGVGMSLVQTPAAAGATRSPAGNRGATLGLFNMLRFSGSTSGTAWVALTYPTGDMLVLFVGCSIVAALGLGMSFYGKDPRAAPTQPVSA